MDDIFSFINIFSENFEKNIISKLIVSKVNNINSENIDYSKITIKPFASSKGSLLTFVYTYKTKDITKNYSIQETCGILSDILGKQFMQADLFLAKGSCHLMVSSKGIAKIINKANSSSFISDTHDNIKQYIINETNTPFLIKLGISSADGKIKNDKRDKFTQINKFLEFFAQALKESKITKEVNAVDMGSGKAYLTFGLMNYLQNILKINAKVQGVEFRQDMVDLGNSNANLLDFNNLTFIKSSIEDYKAQLGTNVLIALHACDTATDDAIFSAIKNNIKLIMLAPCCHKQVRKAMSIPSDMSVFSQYGIVKERLAETLTDLIRSLLLEAHGYRTKMFEFVTAGNTPKNMMITATFDKFEERIFNEKIIQIQKLKEQFGISHHYLEQKLIE